MPDTTTTALQGIKIVLEQAQGPLHYEEMMATMSILNLKLKHFAPCSTPCHGL